MDGILALCHFCESHGPCVILCTQRCKVEPQQLPHTLTVPWCEACQSVNVDQAFVSRDEKTCYVSTRTPQQQDLAFLLKQAAVRGLSCEVNELNEGTNKEGGTLYFGDNERGHVINHTFTLRDSLARGFHRKYSILMLMRDKVHLLNLWPMLVPNMKELAKELQTQADSVNEAEQMQRSQRAVRQAQASPRIVARSLSQLTGQPAIFGHIHLWFTWMLSYQIAVEKPSLGLFLPLSRSPQSLRNLSHEMDALVFRTVCFCVITGCPVEVDNTHVLEAFQVLLPQHWEPLPDMKTCKLTKTNTWSIQWEGLLPNRVPTLQTTVEKALKNEQLPNSALEPYINAVTSKWLHIAQSLVWSNGSNNKQLLQVLGVQSHDLPLINYWSLYCSKSSK